MQEWLDAAGLGRLSGAFQAQGIEFDHLSELTDEDLRELGLTIGERKRFRRALAADKAPPEPGAPGRALPPARRRPHPDK
jgi:hypothetical protein